MMFDSVYQTLYSVVRGFELIEKFKKFQSLGTKNCFFHMVRCTEITVSHRNSNHFKSWMSLQQSKPYDLIYQNFYFVVRAFESIGKFKKVCSLGAKIAFFVMIRCTEIAITHWISNHFQSWMYLMWSKMCDSVYHTLYFDVRPLELMQKSLLV